MEREAMVLFIDIAVCGEITAIHACVRMAIG